MCTAAVPSSLRRIPHGLPEDTGPFWKKETTPEGARWVGCAVSDDAAVARWGVEAGNAVSGLLVTGTRAGAWRHDRHSWRPQRRVTDPRHAWIVGRHVQVRREPGEKAVDTR